MKWDMSMNMPCLTHVHDKPVHALMLVVFVGVHTLCSKHFPWTNAQS